MKMKNTIFVLALFVLFSCVSSPSVKTSGEIEDPGLILEASDANPALMADLPPDIPEPEVPEFIPVKEGSSPLKTKTVSVAARNTPLRDVLYTIAETANLNLVMQKGVQPELPVTMTFKDLSVEDALDVIFDSVDYFYSIKENILSVKAMQSRIFEMGRPNIIQDFKTDVGGDILSGTSSGGGGQTAISGGVTIESVSDKTSFQFWETMEKSLTTLLSIKEDNAGGPQQASFVVNRMAGTIMVTAAKKDLKKVSDYIAALKNVLDRQVLVEARIVEVQLSEDLKYGIDWALIMDGLDEEIITVGTVFFENVVPPTGPNFQINLTDSNDLSLFLTALQGQGEVRTLSNPRVSILNGQTSMLSVGRNTSFISAVETTRTVEGSSTVTTFTVKTNSVLAGVMFGLVPYISEDNEITMTITPIITSLVNLDTKIVGTANGDAVELKLPTVDLREMSTTVKVMDGQIIIIGGLIDKKEKLIEEQVPILGDIPVIGGLFKRIDKTYENTELVIMLIPRIVN